METVTVKTESNYSNSSIEEIHVSFETSKKLNWKEYLLMFWIFCFFSEEFRQVLSLLQLHDKQL